MPCKQFSSLDEMQGEHFDAALIGVWYGGNYGSILTYYALQKVLRDHGYSVLMIDKPKPEGRDLEIDHSYHSRVFAREYYEAVAPLLTLRELHLLNKYVGTFIVGSDQVWNYGISKGFGKSFYLDFVNNRNKMLSYASSFGHGTSNTPSDQIANVARLLNRFDGVSVREAQGVSILRKEFGVIGTQVLDPVFFLDRPTLDGLIDKCDLQKPEKPYLLAYILDPSDEKKNQLIEIAQKRGLELRVLLDMRGNEEEARKIFDMDNVQVSENVHQWLWNFDNAEFVVTDSFHGTSMAILLEKQFVSLVNRRRGATRFETLADLFDLRDHLASDPLDLVKTADGAPEIDYDQINAIKKAEVDRSLRWLLNHMAQKKNADRTIESLAKIECCGCGACANVCPEDAIAMHPDDEGFLYPQVDRDKCTNCSKCRRACPSIRVPGGKFKEPKCFASYTTDPIRMRASSGGIFPILARDFLERGGVVFGAAYTDDFHLVQQSAQTAAELEPLLQSKYLQSDAALTYREAKEALDAGRPVLYVGCPCQVAGLNGFLRKDYDNLLTVDLLCHGGPSQEVFQQYLAEFHPGKTPTYVSFRDKDHFGWSTEMTIKFKDGEEYRETRGKDYFYRAFLPCYAARPHCRVCNFSRLPRQGDITLGDFWGVSKYNKEFTDGNGTSIVSLNDFRAFEVAERLLSHLDLFDEIDLQYILSHGQPFARMFKNASLQHRFFRFMEDLPMKKSVDACAAGDFDCAILGMDAKNQADILSYFALQKLLARQGLAVLMVKPPRQAPLNTSPMKYRLRAFAAQRFPEVSAVEDAGNYKNLLGYCDTLACRSQDDANQAWLPPNVPLLDVAQLGSLTTPDLILSLTDEDADRILDCRNASTPSDDLDVLAVLEAPDALEIADGLTVRFLAADQDMAFNEFFAAIAHAKGLVTDSPEIAALGIVANTPVLGIGSPESALSRYAKEHPLGIVCRNGSPLDQDALDRCREAFEKSAKDREAYRDGLRKRFAKKFPAPYGKVLKETNEARNQLHVKRTNPDKEAEKEKKAPSAARQLFRKVVPRSLRRELKKHLSK